MSDATEQSAANSSCPSDESIAAFVAGEPEEERGELEAHFAECTACRRVLSALAPAPPPEADPSLDDTVSAEEAGLERGQVIDGKYAVEALLTTGGMGVLARARHTVLGTSVVIKLLRAPEVDAETLGRFLREARAGAALDSAFVARVLDAGILETGRPYLVLEHLRGSDFAEVLQKTGPLPVADAVLYVLQAAEALAVAHARGIVHRDIKPANLFLADSSDGSRMLKVLDFGIAKAAEDSGLDDASGNLTGSAAIMGSPRYMSPEQLEQTASVDARTDIWSLGAVLYELLSGAPAFDAPNLAGIAGAILTRQPRPLGELRKDIPPELDAVVLHCLEKRRDQRPADMAELAGQLAPFAPAAAEPVIERIGRIARSRGSLLPDRPDAGKRAPRPRWLWPALAAIAVGIAALALWAGPRVVAALHGKASSAPSAAPVAATTPPLASIAPLATPAVQLPLPTQTAPTATKPPRHARARRRPRVERPPATSKPSMSAIERSALDDRK